MPPSPANAADLEALYRARTDSALARFTEADASFVTRMIAHHAQALEMARLAEERSGSDRVRTLALRIVGAQEDEIALMRRWLDERGQPSPPAPGAPRSSAPGSDRPPVRGAPPAGDPPGSTASHAADHMPGMATPEELDRLEAASGTAFDRLFLSLMIRHHQGAVAMVDELIATPGAAQHPSTFRIASDVRADQTTEIRRMQQMLEALAGTDRDAPRP